MDDVLNANVNTIISSDHINGIKALTTRFGD